MYLHHPPVLSLMSWQFSPKTHRICWAAVFQPYSVWSQFRPWPTVATLAAGGRRRALCGYVGGGQYRSRNSSDHRDQRVPGKSALIEVVDSEEPNHVREQRRPEYPVKPFLLCVAARRFPRRAQPAEANADHRDEKHKRYNPARHPFGHELVARIPHGAIGPA